MASMSQSERYEQYRNVYIEKRLNELGRLSEYERESALTFMMAHLAPDDANMDEVLHEIKVRMRLDERRAYVDPSPMNGPATWPRPRDLAEVGRKAYERLKRKGKIR